MATDREDDMTTELHSPAGLLHPAPYRHVAVTTGSRQVHIAGQTAHDDAGNLVAPDDLAGQVTHALRNVGRALTAASATFSDVVRLTFYVTRWTPEKMTDLMAGFAGAADELDLPQPLPPSSLIGVEALFVPDVLVEVEATAVTD